jgi:hypothetical protein
MHYGITPEKLHGACLHFVFHSAGSTAGSGGSGGGAGSGRAGGGDLHLKT